MDDKPNFDAKDLQYYFEAQGHDTLDLQGRSRRASEVLKIRDRLLALPEKEFDTALLAIRSFLNPSSTDVKDQKPKKKDASELYDLARADQPTPLKMGSL
ncbi:MAG: hypothetical protein EOP10_30500 [Proteobacteria bacterium]|nr:MAG: hypothetical protein EOP10_30500 [Pseudomonadota bacterium]